MNQLNGLRVLELASVLAGPGVGQFFAELGAEVIKVENLRTGGDVTRSWKGAGEKTDDRSAYFTSVNWGKKSVALDLTKTDHADVVRKLATRSDVVIASYKPGDAEKLGVDYASLKKLNPRMIYGQVTGYGSANPKVGYDAIIQAEAGFMFMNGERGGTSLKMPVALIDILAGHHLKEALLLGLLHREKTGEGSFVEVSLIQAAIASLANQATNWLVAGTLPTKKGSAHPNIAPYGDVFRTVDNKEVLLAVGNDRQFEDLCKVLGIGDLANDQKFDTNPKRVENREALTTLLNIGISKWKGPDLVARLNEAKVPAGLIQNLKEVFEMPEARALMIYANGLAGVRSFAANGTVNPLTPPPRLGEHTDEVLRSLDL